MATWAIGDIQGCLKPLENLLSKIKFNPKHDRLWLAGDLIGRGPDSLGVLDLVISLGPSAISVLGNHDLNFLAIDAGVREAKEEDNLDQLLDHPNRQKYINYYDNQSFIIYSPELDAAMAHAGIYPWWSISQCINLSKEITDTLNSDNRRNFLSNIFGDETLSWTTSRHSKQRLKFIINAFTRMRFCDPNGFLNLTEKGTLTSAPKGISPWFKIDNPSINQTRIIFGHWSTLGLIQRTRYIGIDTGCVWGECLTATRIDSKYAKFVSVKCDK